MPLLVYPQTSLDGCIIVEGADDEMVGVFDLTGRQVENRSLANGVYLVRVGNRSARKIVVME